MTQYFLGADLGGTKTRVMISDSSGTLVGFGESGPGNHESVGYEGFRHNLNHAAIGCAGKGSPQSAADRWRRFWDRRVRLANRVRADDGYHRHARVNLSG